jgi:hypothetical protein
VLSRSIRGFLLKNQGRTGQLPIRYSASLSYKLHPKWRNFSYFGHRFLCEIGHKKATWHSACASAGEHIENKRVTDGIDPFALLPRYRCWMRLFGRRVCLKAGSEPCDCALDNYRQFRLFRACLRGSSVNSKRVTAGNTRVGAQEKQLIIFRLGEICGDGRDLCVRSRSLVGRVERQPERV